MIHMTCDQCDEAIPGDTPGGCRVLVGRSEFTFHLCRAHQLMLLHGIRAVLVDPDRLVSVKGGKLVRS